MAWNLSTRILQHSESLRPFFPLVWDKQMLNLLVWDIWRHPSARRGGEGSWQDKSLQRNYEIIGRIPKIIAA